MKLEVVVIPVTDVDRAKRLPMRAVIFHPYRKAQAQSIAEED